MGAFNLHQPNITKPSWRELLTSTTAGATEAYRTVKDILAYERVDPTFKPQSVKVRVWQLASQLRSQWR
jgi:hypothetical protein